ncbi:hypothetical protein ACIHFE_02975 [Streptomyces sp. NPDC052396]|uniref:hypothetical protein n=1 Tax=Streptomyces sp. NPDC052396 TaxID=3365689 RepID=UPI0037D8085B
MPELNNTAGPNRRTGSGLWAPALANLALGVPALPPLYLAWWLLTEYLPMDCRSVADLPGAANCDYTTLDHAPVMMFLLAVTGLPMLALVYLVDVHLPPRRGRRPGVWLGAAALIPAPFATALALA